MIITKKEPFTKEEIEKVREQFGIYIKTVIDVEKQICSAGADQHAELKEVLLKEGHVASETHMWGGGIDLSVNVIDYASYINMRPDRNPSNEIKDPEVHKKFEELTKYFFKEILQKPQ